MRYYFNVRDGGVVLDAVGVECANLSEARRVAVRTSADLLHGIDNDDFWTGEPWIVWVTDRPEGEGNTMLSLAFTAGEGVLVEAPGLIIEVVLPGEDADDEPHLGKKH